MLQQRDLGGEERIFVRLIHPDRAAQHDQEIGIPDRAISEVADRCIAERHAPARAFHDRGEQPQILERHMANGNGGAA
ncbi:hypothetical protein AS156_25110 [Bradyrhizobium macuxiense]|uniref:Uncharacterized protein n=1 Tax=Bradyrhizobium macuxiense TaxID=1755647 RepID=A0A109J7B3_9BRAD|nr:hypothetical protein [Bradyrhizobium macuxiense]KWV43593.1 hypothetical protein AS156_25110 [Bradyrhizobium macuxiense]